MVQDGARRPDQSSSRLLVTSRRAERQARAALRHRVAWLVLAIPLRSWRRAGVEAVVFSAGANRAALARDAWGGNVSNSPETGRATAADGARLAWRLWNGLDDLPRVALVHSLALDGGMWEGVARQLAGAARLLAVDCRGHGASDRLPGPYSTAQFADDLAAVLDALRWDAASVVGCSMGGCVAQDFAARHAARTEALVLVDTTAWYGRGAPEAWRERAEVALRGGMTALSGFQAERWFTPEFNAAQPEVLARWLGVFAANDPACYAAACAMLGAADLRPVLPRIAAPTTVLVGEEDGATPPAMARALADAIPGATLQVIRGARHLSPIEAPASVAAAIAALLPEARP
jgi:3-oxoadipate enol-lactonase